MLNIDLADDFIFKGDENLISFVIFNLLKNALLHRAKIEIWLDSKTKSLHFKDKRVEIHADKLELIFDEHKSPLRMTTGTGLSFLFCKRVMDAFGGDVCVKSEEGEGTEFCLKF